MKSFHSHLKNVDEYYENSLSVLMHNDEECAMAIKIDKMDSPGSKLGKLFQNYSTTAEFNLSRYLPAKPLLDGISDIAFQCQDYR